MSRATITVQVEEPRWRNCGVDPGRVRAAARLALARGLESKTAEGERRFALTILLANDARLRDLNAQFRNTDSPTNVLSFPAPAGSGGYLGDVALALDVAAREAAAAGKRLSDHAAHLTVHGVLHLLGYDHLKAREARTMESLETAVLHELGIANPYAPAAAAE
jgi:probable rRNA maturation factor